MSDTTPTRSGGATTTTPPGHLVQLAKAHYRAAERICANASWPGEVQSAAEAIGANRVDHLTLVQRAREILLRGPTYTALRGGRYILMGASLIDEGGFVPLQAVPAAGDAP